MRMSSVMSWSVVGGLCLTLGCTKDEAKKDEAAAATKTAGAPTDAPVDAKADAKAAANGPADAKAPGNAEAPVALPTKAAGKPIGYVPDVATIVGGADLAGLQGTPSWKESQGMIAAEDQATLAAMTACNLGLEKWKSVTFGVDANGGPEQIVVVIVAEGLGKPESLDCAKGKLAERNGGKEPWTTRPDGKTLELQDGQVAHVVDTDTIVLAGKAWAADVEKLVRGEGKAAVDGALADVIARTDTSRHVWFAGKLPPEAKASAAMLGDVGNPQDVAGWLDLSTGLEVWAAVGFPSAEEAAKAKLTTSTQLEALKPLGASLGVPQAVIDSIKLDTKDNAATVTAKASTADLETIRQKVLLSAGGMPVGRMEGYMNVEEEAKAPAPSSTSAPTGGLGPDRER